MPLNPLSEPTINLIDTLNVLSGSVPGYHVYTEYLPDTLTPWECFVLAGLSADDYDRHNRARNELIALEEQLDQAHVLFTDDHPETLVVPFDIFIQEFQRPGLQRNIIAPQFDCLYCNTAYPLNEINDHFRQCDPYLRFLDYVNQYKNRLAEGITRCTTCRYYILDTRQLFSHYRGCHCESVELEEIDDDDYGDFDPWDEYEFGYQSN